VIRSAGVSLAFFRHAECEESRRRDAGATKFFRPWQNKLFFSHSLESS
jgi:hypothetical protein